MSTTRVKLAGLSLAAILGLTACGGASSGGDANVDDPVGIRVTITNDTGPYSVPWLVAMEQGMFEDRGVMIEEIIPGKGGASTIQNQVSGDLPIADVSFPAVLDAVAAGAELTVIGGATQSLVGNEIYALATNDAVNSLQDVKTWAYTNEGSVTQAISYLLPPKLGIPDTQIERIASGGTGEGIALLEAGSVDVTIVPLIQYFQNESKYKRIADPTEEIPNFQQTVITSPSGYAAEHPGVLEAVLAGYQEALEWVAANPQQAAEIHAEYTGEDVDATLQMIETSLAGNFWGVGYNADAIATAIEARELVSAKPEAADVCAIFVDDYLPEGASTKVSDDC